MYLDGRSIQDGHIYSKILDYKHKEILLVFRIYDYPKMSAQVNLYYSECIDHMQNGLDYVQEEEEDMKVRYQHACIYECLTR